MGWEKRAARRNIRDALDVDSGFGVKRVQGLNLNRGAFALGTFKRWLFSVWLVDARDAAGQSLACFVSFSNPGERQRGLLAAAALALWAFGALIQWIGDP